MDFKRKAIEGCNSRHGEEQEAEFDRVSTHELHIPPIYTHILVKQVTVKIKPGGDTNHHIHTHVQQLNGKTEESVREERVREEIEREERWRRREIEREDREREERGRRRRREIKRAGRRREIERGEREEKDKIEREHEL